MKGTKRHVRICFKTACSSCARTNRWQKGSCRKKM